MLNLLFYVFIVDLEKIFNYLYYESEFFKNKICYYIKSSMNVML